jgi:protein phosphatase
VYVRTTDHTRVQEQVRRGELTPEQAAGHADAHVLSQALGGAGGVTPIAWKALALEAGDILLLCSDGLHDMLDDAAIGAVLAEDHGYADAAQALVDEANRRGGHDNIGVALVVVGQRRTSPANGRRR